ncbi:MAG TPA: hypothetical protein VNN19_09555 [bacterium]|nr:hypothetical protein [bacterium]
MFRIVRWMAIPVVLVVAVAAYGAMMEGPADRELATATTHAKLAATQSTLAATEQHLHHVLNCIEGKDGKNYLPSSGDPCQGMGKGLLADLQGAGMAGGHALPYVEIAQSVATWGIAQGMRKDFARAKAAAQLTQTALERATANFK